MSTGTATSLGGEYVQARRYDSKEEAMQVAESLAMHSEFVYQVEEVDECDFVLKEYRV